MLHSPFQVLATLPPHPLPPTSRLLLADHLLLTSGSRHVGWASADKRAELSRHNLYSHGCQGNGEGPQDPDGLTQIWGRGMI